MLAWVDMLNGVRTMHAGCALTCAYTRLVSRNLFVLYRGALRSRAMQCTSILICSASDHLTLSLGAL